MTTQAAGESVSAELCNLLPWAPGSKPDYRRRCGFSAVPEGIDAAAVESYLCTLSKVVEVHDLHIWGMSTTEAAPGQNDAWIPTNVAQAVNFYQLDGLLHGRSQIRATDPSRTQILGNFQFNYKSKPVSCEGYPWFAKVFTKPHIEIECDPAVWLQVESLIRSKLPRIPPGE